MYHVTMSFLSVTSGGGARRLRSLIGMLALVAGLVLTGCDASSPRSPDAAPDPAPVSSIDIETGDFFTEHADGLIAEAQAAFDQRYPGAVVTGLSFAPRTGADLALSDWCGSDGGEAPSFDEVLRHRLAEWIEQHGGPPTFTVTSAAALPPHLDASPTGDPAGATVVDPSTFPVYRVSTSGAVSELSTQPLPDPFDRPEAHPFVNVERSVVVNGELHPPSLSPQEQVQATEEIASQSPQFFAELETLLDGETHWINVTIEVERVPVGFGSKQCWWTDPPPSWCDVHWDPCTLNPGLCEFKQVDPWPNPLDGPITFYGTPDDLTTVATEQLTPDQQSVIETGDRLLTPSGETVGRVYVTPDFEGAGVERP